MKNNQTEMREQVTAALQLLDSLGYKSGDIVDGLRNVEQNLRDTVASFQYGEDELTDVADEIDVPLYDTEIESMAKEMAEGNHIQTEVYPAVRKAVELAVGHYRSWKASGISL